MLSFTAGLSFYFYRFTCSDRVRFSCCCSQPWNRCTFKTDLNGSATVHPSARGSFCSASLRSSGSWCGLICFRVVLRSCADSLIPLLPFTVVEAKRTPWQRCSPPTMENYSQKSPGGPEPRPDPSAGWAEAPGPLSPPPSSCPPLLFSLHLQRRW